MSNILPEDVKLMAEFMGWKELDIYNDCMLVGIPPDKEGWTHALAVPNYPKDMNALLGVITELVARQQLHEIKADRLLADAIRGCDGNYTDLAGLVFIELVEAIKQIKESE